MNFKGGIELYVVSVFETRSVVIPANVELLFTASKNLEIVENLLFVKLLVTNGSRLRLLALI